MICICSFFHLVFFHQHFDDIVGVFLDRQEYFDIIPDRH